MIHLRKYNESNNIQIDIDYIKDCFIDFIDIKSTVISNNVNSYYINIKEVTLERNYNNGNFSINSYIESCKKHTEFYLDIENSIDKVKLKYTNYKFDTYLSSRLGDTFLTIRIYT